MPRIAALFPGQGSQTVGMGQDLVEAWPLAADVFARTDQTLGMPLSELCWQGPEDELRLTQNTQPALLTHSIAAWRVLEAAGLRVEAVAGHSLGEYSAAVIAGALQLDDAVRTVRLRGQLMQQAVPVGEGAMAAVIGLDEKAVRAACIEATDAGFKDPSGGTDPQSKGIVVAANFNAPTQIVIAGHASAVARAIVLCSERGARKTKTLPVSAPFHSPLMAPAREGLEPALRQLQISDPAVPLYRNVDAAPVLSALELRDGLINQVDAPVRWTETIQRMWDDGFDTFVEIGPGKALGGMVRRIVREAKVYSAGTVESVQQLMEPLGLAS